MQSFNWLKKAAAACCLLGFAQFASAGVISFDPTPSDGHIVGDNILVDLVWNGSGTGAAGADEYLGAWDVDINFDDSIVSYQSTTFGFGVDSFGCIDGVTCGASELGGTLDAFEISFDLVADLMANQDGLGNSFVIATFEFLAIADGVTDLTFASIGGADGTLFGDEAGNNITDQTRLADGQICVGAAGCDVVVGVPTPETLPLVLFGLLAFGGMRLRKQQAA